MVGTKTNVVTSVEVTDTAKHDSHFLEPLLALAAEATFSASRRTAYSSRVILQRIHDASAIPLIPFKYNATGKSPSPGVGAELWEKMFHFYMYRREEFLGFYYRRSNIETTFHMIKSKFRPNVRSKTVAAQLDEVLCKVLCHNLCCLVQRIYELGSSPGFGRRRSMVFRDRKLTIDLNHAAVPRDTKSDHRSDRSDLATCERRRVDHLWLVNAPATGRPR